MVKSSCKIEILSSTLKQVTGEKGEYQKAELRIIKLKTSLKQARGGTLVAISMYVNNIFWLNCDLYPADIIPGREELPF